MQQVRQQVVERALHSDPLGGAELPQADAIGPGDAAQHSEGVQVHVGVPQRVGARFFPRATAVQADLFRHQIAAVMLPRHRLEGLVAGQRGIRRHLRRPPRGVIVAGLLLVEPLLAGGHPFQEIRVPLAHAIAQRAAEHSRLFEQPDALRRVNHGYRVDQPRTASGIDAAHRLPVLQIRIHARLRVQEPRREDPRRMFAARPIAEQVRAHAERQHRRAHVAQIAPVGLKAPRIPLAILADIRPLGILRVGPPVRPFAVVVVSARRDVVRPLTGHGPRSRLEGGAGILPQRVGQGAAAQFRRLRCGHQDAALVARRERGQRQQGGRAAAKAPPGNICHAP